ncbi:hypothetical protein ACH4TQ_45420 [Streptomyces sp. NPDC021218]|uniref:hypothetical protein n=1 Tax=unclassified Streptomyces TaxID=2593676 RepID=UPI00368CAF40
MAASTLGELLGPADEEAEAEMRRLPATRYNAVRPFLSLLGESSALGPASGSQRVLAAVKKLPALARRKAKVKPLLPRQSGVPRRTAGRCHRPVRRMAQHHPHAQWQTAGLTRIPHR